MKKCAAVFGKLILLSLSLSVAACATANHEQSGVDNVKRDIRAENKESVITIPEWFNAPPSDSVSISGVATGFSNDMQLSIDKATQDAKASLADKLQGYISGKMKKFIEESGSGNDLQMTTDAEKTSISLFTNVNLAGYSVKSQKVVQEGTGYRSFVLLTYPIGEANRLLADKIKQNSRLTAKLAASKSYEELQRDAEKSNKP